MCGPVTVSTPQITNWSAQETKERGTGHEKDERIWRED